MPQDRSFHDYVIHDLFRGIPGITSRAMFGGWGIYQDGAIFAIIVDGELYFKVDERSRPAFERLGSHPFVYTQGDHKPTVMPYWLLPMDVMEDEEELREWVEAAVRASRNIARRNASAK